MFVIEKYAHAKKWSEGSGSIGTVLCKTTQTFFSTFSTIPNGMLSPTGKAHAKNGRMRMDRLEWTDEDEGRACERMDANSSLLMGCLHSCGVAESMVTWVLDEVEGRGMGEHKR